MAYSPYFRHSPILVFIFPTYRHVGGLRQVNFFFTMPALTLAGRASSS